MIELSMEDEHEKSRFTIGRTTKKAGWGGLNIKQNLHQRKQLDENNMSHLGSA